MNAQSTHATVFDINSKVLLDKYVIKTSENYMGLSYADIITTWQRWVLSDNPDQRQFGDILFLRGNIGYHKSSSTFLQAHIDIPEGVAILVPVVTTHYNLGENYDGQIIEDEFSLRKAVREHVDAAGPFWATLQINPKHSTVVKLVPNLSAFRVESMPFELDISKTNPFLNEMDEPNYPGRYTAMVSGYFVLIHDLPPLSYRIRFGGYGMDDFYTDSLYEINITQKDKITKDISGPKFSASHLLMEKKDAIKTHSALFWNSIQ